MRNHRQTFPLALLAAASVAFVGCSEKPADPAGPADALTGQTSTYADDPYMAAAEKAVAFLLTRQNDDGGFGSHGGRPASNVGTTAIVAAALLDSPLGLTEASSPELARAVRYIVENQQPDGSIMVRGQGMANYHTSAAVMALVRTGNPEHKPALERAEGFFRGIQFDESQGFDPSNPFYGGVGYSRNPSVTDLSNTGFAIEAMHELGLEPDDPFFEKALVFLKRVTNNPEVNDLEWAAEVTPESFGGAVYRPAPDPARAEVDISKAGHDRTGWRSYGSMTYHAFKSFIYAGVSRDDPAVLGALDWIGRNYTLDENPGIGAEGQYYYYRVFSKALDAWGEDKIAGRDWARDLADKLVALQDQDGSWVNKADRWYEGDPALVTAYSLEALSRAMKRLAE